MGNNTSNFSDHSKNRNKSSSNKNNQASTHVFYSNFNNQNKTNNSNNQNEIPTNINNFDQENQQAIISTDKNKTSNSNNQSDAPTSNNHNNRKKTGFSSQGGMSQVAISDAGKLKQLLKERLPYRQKSNKPLVEPWQGQLYSKSYLEYFPPRQQTPEDLKKSFLTPQLLYKLMLQCIRREKQRVSNISDKQALKNFETLLQFYRFISRDFANRKSSQTGSDFLGFIRFFNYMAQIGASTFERNTDKKNDNEINFEVIFTTSRDFLKKYGQDHNLAKTAHMDIEDSVAFSRKISDQKTRGFISAVYKIIAKDRLVNEFSAYLLENLFPNADKTNNTSSFQSLLIQLMKIGLVADHDHRTKKHDFYKGITAFDKIERERYAYHSSPVVFFLLTLLPTINNPYFDPTLLVGTYVKKKPEEIGFKHSKNKKYKMSSEEISNIKKATDMAHKQEKYFATSQIITLLLCNNALKKLNKPTISKDPIKYIILKLIQSDVNKNLFHFLKDKPQELIKFQQDCILRYVSQKNTIIDRLKKFSIAGASEYHKNSLVKALQETSDPQEFDKILRIARFTANPENKFSQDTQLDVREITYKHCLNNNGDNQQLYFNFLGSLIETKDKLIETETNVNNKKINFNNNNNNEYEYDDQDESDDIPIPNDDFDKFDNVISNNDNNQNIEQNDNLLFFNNEIIDNNLETDEKIDLKNENIFINNDYKNSNNMINDNKQNDNTLLSSNESVNNNAQENHSKNDLIKTDLFRKPLKNTDFQPKTSNDCQKKDKTNEERFEVLSNWVEKKLNNDKENKKLKKFKKKLNTFEETYKCPILLEIMDYPTIVLPSGKTYSKVVVDDLKKKNMSCPMTCQEITTSGINYDFKSALESRLEKLEAKKDELNKELSSQTENNNNGLSKNM